MSLESIGRTENGTDRFGGSVVNKLNYNHPVVASFLLLGGIFIILGFSRGFAFFLVGAVLILGGVRANRKLQK
jgi:hypothetical protein